MSLKEIEKLAVKAGVTY